jgi:hypothetical protein
MAGIVVVLQPSISMGYLSESDETYPMPSHQFAVAICIAILFPMLVHHGASLIRSAPRADHRLEAFVGTSAANRQQARASETETRAMAKRLNDELGALDEVIRSYFQLLCFVVPLGLAAMLIGSYTKDASVGTGLTLGGMAAVADGYADYWNHVDSSARFVALLIGLGMATFVIYWRLVVIRAASP